MRADRSSIRQLSHSAETAAPFTGQAAQLSATSGQLLVLSCQEIGKLPLKLPHAVSINCGRVNTYRILPGLKVLSLASLPFYDQLICDSQSHSLIYRSKVI